MAQFSTNAKSLFGDLSSSFSDNLDNIGDNFKSSVNSLRRLVGDDSVPPADLEAQLPPQPPQQSFSEEMGALFNLTFFQRLALFAMIFGTGILMICISFSFLPFIVLAPHKFAAAFTMGNILAIVSTWVLVGPRAQLQTMFHPVRAVAAGIYVTSLVVALVAAFFGGKFRYVIVLVALIAELASCKLSGCLKEFVLTILCVRLARRCVGNMTLTSVRFCCTIIECVACCLSYR